MIAGIMMWQSMKWSEFKFKTADGILLITKCRANERLLLGETTLGFPFQVNAHIESHNGAINRTFAIHSGLTVLIGPNGSGKTHLLRGLIKTSVPHAGGKHVRFISAGRIGVLENFRSDYDGQRGTPRYDAATYGTKGDASRRHKIETMVGDFQTLAARADIYIKIQERLRKLFKRDLFIEWEGGNLKISFATLAIDSRPYSSGREASGLMHLVAILAALYDDEIGVLLIDEPEVSLHPQLQAFLLREILGVADLPSAGTNKKLVIIATHSTEMIRIAAPRDLLSLVFCYDLNANLVQVSPGAGELQNKKIQGLIARLGQEHKLSLFCKRPLLVEGPSDAIICTALANKLDLNLEAAGSQLLPVVGKGQMPIVA
jgi:energy-coupling factor transporter ATP-binding protein EcfA2